MHAAGVPDWRPAAGNCQTLDILFKTVREHWHYSPFLLINAPTFVFRQVPYIKQRNAGSPQGAG